MKSDMVMPPPGNFTEDDLYLRKRWRKVQCITNLFWKRWQSEYVHMLQQRQKWKKPKRNVTQGDIVMLTDDDICHATHGSLAECYKCYRQKANKSDVSKYS